MSKKTNQQLTHQFDERRKQEQAKGYYFTAVIVVISLFIIMAGLIIGISVFGSSQCTCETQLSPLQIGVIQKTTTTSTTTSSNNFILSRSHI